MTKEEIEKELKELTVQAIKVNIKLRLNGNKKAWAVFMDELV